MTTVAQEEGTTLLVRLLDVRANPEGGARTTGRPEKGLGKLWKDPDHYIEAEGCK